MASITLLDDVLDLASLLRPAWAGMSEELRAAGVPVCEDDDADTDDADKDKDDADADADADAGADKDDADDKDDDAEPAKPADDLATWKKDSRRHEREAKKARAKAKEFEDKLKEIEGQNATEQEKAITKARDEATAEATSGFEQARRADRLEVAVARLDKKGVKVEVEDDDEKTVEKTVRFVDLDDVQDYIQRAVDREEIDAADLFGEDGKVKPDALTSALADLAGEKSHWLVPDEKPDGKGKPAGDADGGKGKGAGKGLGEFGPEDHLKAIRRTTS